MTMLFENNRNYLLADPELELIGPRAKLAFWRHQNVGPSFYRLGRKIIYTGTDLNTWTNARRVETENSETK